MSDAAARANRPERPWLRGREIVPDPHGVVSLCLIVAVLASHLALPVGGGSLLLSDQRIVQVLAHGWFLLGPPLALYLGLRHLLTRGDSLLPLLTVPFSLFLTAVTIAGVALALLGTGS